MPFQDLEIEFPALADTIAKSRQTNARLDEICSDYELLLGDYRRMAVNATPHASAPCSDIEETLAGLLEEIAAVLGAEVDPKRR